MMSRIKFTCLRQHLLSNGFQVYHQFLCEVGFQRFCAGPILIANYILISPLILKINTIEIYLILFKPITVL